MKLVLGDYLKNTVCRERFFWCKEWVIIGLLSRILPLSKDLQQNFGARSRVYPTWMGQQGKIKEEMIFCYDGGYRRGIIPEDNSAGNSIVLRELVVLNFFKKVMIVKLKRRIAGKI